MGLNGDPSILRHRSSSLSNHLNLLSEKYYILKHSNRGNYINYDHGIRISGIIRSNSDGDCNSCETSEVKNSVAGVRGITVKSDGANFMENYSHTERSSSGHESPGSSALSQKKPPKGKLKMNCTRNESYSSLLLILRNGVDEGVECNGAADNNELCMIKNLDNGKKFVVNDVSEDGMWENIKEVGTGRQLTMEEFSSEICIGTSTIVQELTRRQNVEDGNREEGLDPNVDGSYGSASKSKKKVNWLSIKKRSEFCCGA